MLPGSNGGTTADARASLEKSRLLNPRLIGFLPRLEGSGSRYPYNATPRNLRRWKPRILRPVNLPVKGTAPRRAVSAPWVLANAACHWKCRVDPLSCGTFSQEVWHTSSLILTFYSGGEGERSTEAQTSETEVHPTPATAGNSPGAGGPGSEGPSAGTISALRIPPWLP